MRTQRTSRLSRFLADDAGITLLELTIAMTIGLVVMGVAYMFVFSSNSGSRITTRMVADNRAVGASLDLVAREIRESQRRLHAEDYFLEITADPNNDGVLEDVQYTLGTDGKLWAKVQNLSQTVTVSNRIIAENLNNRSVNTPLFKYYVYKSPSNNPAQDVIATPDSSYSPPKDGDRLTKATVITINPSGLSDPASGAQAFKAKTDIFLRNASPGQ